MRLFRLSWQPGQLADSVFDCAPLSYAELDLFVIQPLPRRPFPPDVLDHLRIVVESEILERRISFAIRMFS